MTLTSKNGRYLSQKDIARILAISTGTVRRLIKDNELETYRFGNQIRIVAESLDTYICR